MIAILLIASLVWTTLRGVSPSPCGCIGPDRQSDRSSPTVDDGCCGDPLQASEPAPVDGAPWDSDCPEDECPEPCCTAVKVPVLTLKAPAPVVLDPGPQIRLLDDLGGPSLAHLDRLPKPPIGATPLSQGWCAPIGA